MPRCAPATSHDPASLGSAFAGVDRLLLISTDIVGTRLPQHRAAIDAAGAAGVQEVLYTSMLNPSDSNPIGVTFEHRGTEEHLRASGMAWTFLRNGIYTEMLADAAAAAIATGMYLSNEGDGGTSHVSRADCAAVAAAALARGGQAGKELDVTGPEALTATERAAVFAELSGKPVAPLLVDDAAYVATLVEQAGVPEPAARLYASFGTGARNGYSAPVSTTVADLTGTPPRSVRGVLAGLLA